MKRLVVIIGLCWLATAVPLAAQDAAGSGKLPEIQSQKSQSAMTPAAALERLKEGNRRFVANMMKQRDWSAKVTATAAGQFPFAAVLGCMDSRVPLEILFD